jgi:hypothetical protein
MPKEKGEEWQHVTIVEESSKGIKVKCVYCSKIFVGGALRIRNHLAGDYKSSDTIKCSAAPVSVADSFKRRNEEKEVVAKKKQKQLQLDVATNSSVSSMHAIPATATQATVPGLFASQLGGKEAADRALARLFYANAIPFNVSDSKYYKEAIKAVAACGPTYVPPGRKAIGTTLLDKELAVAKQQVEEAKKKFTGQGVTLVSDGWTSVQNRPIINFLMVSSEGATFLTSVDTSGQEKNADFIEKLLEERINEIGQDKIVQVVMDSAASCVAAGKILMKKFPSILSSPCAAHCLDLLLEDIAKLQWIGNVIDEGHEIVKFVTNHQASLACFRSHSQLELLKPGETRFATNFIMLRRLQQCKDDLQETVVSKEYKQWVSKPKYATVG